MSHKIMNYVTAKKAGDDDGDDDDAVQSDAVRRRSPPQPETRPVDPRRLVSDRSSGSELQANDLNSR